MLLDGTKEELAYAIGRRVPPSTLTVPPAASMPSQGQTVDEQIQHRALQLQKLKKKQLEEMCITHKLHYCKYISLLMLYNHC